MSQWGRFLVTWGCGHGGRLGLGDNSNRKWPHVVLTSLSSMTMKTASAGGAHTIAMAENGTVFTCGQNDRGQLGHSALDSFMALPLEVGLPVGIVSVSAGEKHSLLLSQDGEVWSFGSNDSGQLGTGNKQQEPLDLGRNVEPRIVQSLKGIKIVQVEAGATHSLALDESGGVWSWGQSAFGALGHGDVMTQRIEWSPRKIRALEDVKIKSLARSSLYSAGCIDVRGRAWSWGNGLYWQLGSGECGHQFVPRRIEALRSCDTLALGQMHGMGVSRGQVLVWGTDQNGTLGQGEGVSNWQQRPIDEPREVPLNHPALKANRSKVVSVRCGWKSSGLLTSDGKIFTWGWNGAYHSDPFSDSGSGVLGLGDEKDRWSPNLVQRLMVNKKAYDLRMPVLKPWRFSSFDLGRNHAVAVVEAEIHPLDLTSYSK